MKRFITFLVLMAVVLTYIVSIDACLAYGPDGKECKQCITGFQLLNNKCQPNTKGCEQYSVDGKCLKCEQKTILANNQCCDSACFEKYLKKSSFSTQKYPVQDNTQHISDLIQAAEKKLSGKNVTSLESIDTKIFKGVERWFFLFKIENSSYQRVVVDSSPTFNSLVVDSSTVRNTDEFNEVEWKQVENVDLVLGQFPALYSQGVQYAQVFAKIALLSQIQQFEIVTISEQQAITRILYQSGQQTVVLKETITPVKPNTDTPVLPKTSTSTSSNTGGSTTNTPSQSSSSVFEERGATHTTYNAPLDGEIKELAQKLVEIKDKETSKNKNPTNKPATPFIGAGIDPYATVAAISQRIRRLVVSSFCQGSSYREIALVSGDGYTLRENFDYYFETQDSFGQKQWFFLGNRTKIQQPEIFKNPSAYPIYVSDPSFVLYPYASLYFQRGVPTLYQSRLQPQDQAITFGSIAVKTSEKDRLMGKFSRFSVDGMTQDNSKYRMTGWQISQVPDGFEEDDQMVSMVCSQAMITESYVIGGSGKKVQQPEQKTEKSAQKPSNDNTRGLIYTGVDIDAQLDVNEPLIAAVDVLKSLASWNYVLKEVQEVQSTSGIVEFIIVGENQSGKIRCVVVYNQSNSKATLISIDPIREPKTSGK